MSEPRRVTKYRGWRIERSEDGYYRVIPPISGRWPEPAINHETAKRWIDCHLAEHGPHAR